MKSFSGIVKSFFKRADIFLLVMCIACTLFGIVAIRSATLSFHSSKYIFVQAFAMCLGLGAFAIFTFLDPDLIADKWMLLTVLSALFILGLIVFGHDDGTGNRAWYRFLGIGVQPSEFVKLVFIVILAKQLTNYRERRELNRFKSILMLGIHFAFYFGLIIVVSKDLGSALIFLAIFVVMLIAAGVAWYWMGIAAAAVAAMIPIFWNFLLSDYQKERILVPYIPEVIDPTGTERGWQATQTKNALAAGRFWGVGRGNGSFSQGNFNAKHTDCIFASIGEEMGMVACILILLLLTVVIIRCCVVGMRSGTSFGALICFGIAASLAFQVFINTGMCIGITPVIGITLPFFSYGGSSIVATYTAMGIVSGIKYRPKPQKNFLQY